MRQTLIIISIALFGITSCKKEETEMGSQISVTQLTGTSVEVSATVYVSNPPESTIEHGIRFSTQSKDYANNWSYDETTVPVGNGSAGFTKTISNLTANTNYFFHPYAYVAGKLYRGDEIEYIPSSTTYQIGDVGPGGGIVFYLDGTGGGKEAHHWSVTSDWGCQGTSIGGLNQGFGYGLWNSEQIQSNCGVTSSAAYICLNLSTGGYADWYLPSVDELDSLYNNAYLFGHMPNINPVPYFSSNQTDAVNAWTFNFNDGSVSFQQKGSPHDYLIAIRDF